MPLLEKFSLKGSSKAGTDAHQQPDPVPEYTGLISNGNGAPPSYSHPAASADPPSYEPVSSPNGAFDNELNAAFSSLNVSEIPPAFPEADQCLAHLKLLSTFHTLKEDIGYTDGIFGLWDAKCEMATNRDEALAKMREKRWALYIARSVERFEDWWVNVLCNMEPCRRLEGKEMVEGVATFTEFTKRGRAKQWTQDMLPPIDVLMVWHSFMLNPRCYLEDCLRFGLKDLWVTGMPWAAVNTAIDTSFNYVVPEKAKTDFAKVTGHDWENAHDSMSKNINCPRCFQALEVPWTTCCANEKTSSRELSEMGGRGYGDRGFSYACQKCGANVNHEFLRVGKFKSDVENVIMRDWPLGGTILSPSTGSPDAATADQQPNSHPNTFPNRLFRIALRAPVLEVVNSDAPTMEQVKILIEKAIADKTVVKSVNGKTVFESGSLQRSERIATRKTMTRYWTNNSIFALELGGAVVRQGIFVDKMYSIDWLHSPAARETMDRLLLKYSRFINIIGSYPMRMAVPTLDVDLGWHTHQLSPSSYYDFTITKCKKFIDHDDKIDEDTLSKSFEWTSKTYESTYGEVYSECTCWYCEAIRAKYQSGKLFGASKQEKALNKFHDSGAAQLCLPDRSAHISAHSSVTMAVNPYENPTRAMTTRMLRKRHDMELEVAYTKACKRAKAKGRPVPERNEYYQGAWGYPYAMYGPYMALGMMGGMYYAADPCVGAFGAGTPGNCAIGTCGPGVVVGGVGGCGGGCGGGGCGGGGGGCGGGGS